MISPDAADRAQLLERLNRLTPSQLSELILLVGLPGEHLPPETVAAGSRVTAIADYCLRTRPEYLEKLLKTLEKLLPSEFPDPLTRLARVERLERLLRERAHLPPAHLPVELMRQIETDENVLRDTMHARAGLVVAGARLERPLGSGNFGTIWLAHEEGAVHKVAVKLFRVDLLTQGIALLQFRRSIEGMRKLSLLEDRPSSIVKLHRASEDTLAFSMDYLSGGNLEDVMRWKWTLAQKVDVFLEICRAVDYAHRHGIIHRDIKPANVLLTREGRPVLTDFDISDMRFLTRLSVSAGNLGTFVFAAPEQIENLDDATEQSDVYSLGRLLYFMLLERSPGLQLEADPSLKNLADYPETLVSAIRAATQSEPARRTRDVESVIRTVSRYLSKRARLRAYLQGLWRLTRKVWIYLVLVLLLIGGSFAGLLYYRELSQQLQVMLARLNETNDTIESQNAQLSALNHRLLELIEKVEELRTSSNVISVKLSQARGEVKAYQEALKRSPGDPNLQAKLLTAQKDVTNLEEDDRRVKDELARLEQEIKQQTTRRQSDAVAANQANDLRTEAPIQEKAPVNLSGKEVRQSDLKANSLKRARLVNSKLNYLDFEGNDLSGADLRGADLYGATGLSSARLDGICYDNATRWPTGFAPPPSVCP